MTIELITTLGKLTMLVIDNLFFILVVGGVGFIGLTIFQKVIDIVKSLLKGK